MRWIVCILTITIIVLIGTAGAAPIIPEQFYGSVFLNGNPAPAGTVIIAKINGEVHGNFTTTETGLYGSSGNFDPRLTVVLTEEEMKTGNNTITFYVGGIQAFQTVPFVSGGGMKLDLIANEKAFAVDTTVVTTYSSSSGSTSGSGYSSGGSVSSATGSGTSMTSGNVPQGITATSIPTTASRSSIYYNIDAPQTTPATTIIPTATATPSSVVTTVPTTKKAGSGPLSLVFLGISIIAVLGILYRTGNSRNR
jgi:hypothetical protein